MTIDLLCKVVDNYGDIGFVYRLAKGLRERLPESEIRIIIDKLPAFKMLAPGIDPGRAVQRLSSFLVVDWNHPWEGFRKQTPRIVLECFASGRPPFFEDILFDPARKDRRLILNIEHLSAEPWVDELHLMQSATRDALVEKKIFMPGFTPGSGGLIMDSRFLADLEKWETAFCQGDVAVQAARARILDTAGIEDTNTLGAFWFTAFSYERDYTGIFKELTAFSAIRPLRFFAAAGPSQDAARLAWLESGKPFPFIALPFLEQEQWDEFLMASNFSIVRGEESLARAALIGRPFIWHAYLQENAHHLVKVKAFASLLAATLPPEPGEKLGKTFVDFNTRVQDRKDLAVSGRMADMLENYEIYKNSFRVFAKNLAGLGDLCARLVTFLQEFGIN